MWAPVETQSMPMPANYGALSLRGIRGKRPAARWTYGWGELDTWSMPYACTIHKSQGSEYPLWSSGPAHTPALRHAAAPNSRVRTPASPCGKASWWCWYGGRRKHLRWGR